VRLLDRDGLAPRAPSRIAVKSESRVVRRGCRAAPTMNSSQWRYPRGVVDPPEPLVLRGGPLQLYEGGVCDPRVALGRARGHDRGLDRAGDRRRASHGVRVRADPPGSRRPRSRGRDHRGDTASRPRRRDSGDRTAQRLARARRRVPRRARPRGPSGIQRGPTRNSHWVTTQPAYSLRSARCRSSSTEFCREAGLTAARSCAACTALR
jgi:hypothetical protein